MGKTLYRLDGWALLLLGLTAPLSIAAVNIALGLAMLVLIARITTDSSSARFLARGISIPLAVYLAIDFSAVFLSGYPTHPADWFEDKWVLVAYIAGLGLASQPIIATRSLTGFAAAGALMGLYGIYQFFSGYDPLRGVPLEPWSGGYLAVGVFSHHLTYGGVVLAAFLVSISATLFVKIIRQKILFALLALLSGAGLAASYARSAMLGAVAGLGILIALKQGKTRRNLLVSAAIIVIVLLVAFPGLWERFGNAFSSGEHSESPRVRLWLSSLAIIAHHPLFGVGQSNFGTAFEQYKLPGEYVSTAHPHCDLLSIAVDGGLVALAVFIFVLVVFFRRASRSIGICRSGDYSPYRWLFAAAISLTVAILVAGLFQNYLSDAEVANIFWLVIGLAMGVEARMANSND
jgi:O-antigen ligase